MVSRLVIDAIADTSIPGGASLATTCCWYAKGDEPSKTFTVKSDTPRAAIGSECHTIRRVGKGAIMGPSTRLPGMSDSMPLATTRVNSASVVPGGDSRMLTLAIPAGVSSSKLGGVASVAGEPVQADTAIDPRNGKKVQMRIAIPLTQRMRCFRISRTFRSSLGMG